MEGSLKDELEYNRYQMKSRIVIPNQELLDLRDFIASHEIPEIPSESRRLGPSLKLSKEFLLSHYRINPVPFLFEKRILGMFDISLEKQQLDPFKLPIKLVPDEDDFYGSLREVLTINTCAKRCDRIHYRFIELSKRINELTALSYTHEITHTQANFHENAIKDYFNSEFLSIFNELLHSIEQDKTGRLLRMHDNYRINEIVCIIDEINKHKDSDNIEIQTILSQGSCYLTSTLKAYYLLLKYLCHQASIQKEIISYIQKIFDGERSYEDLLDHFDITTDNPDDIKKLKKYIERGQHYDSIKR